MAGTITARIRAWGALAALAGALTLPWAAPPVGASPGPLTRLGLDYEVYRGGFHVLAANLNLALAADRYEVTARVQTTGFLGWWVEWSQIARSVGSFVGARPEPDRHLVDGTLGGKVRRVEIDYAAGQVTDLAVYPPAQADGREPVSPTLRQGAVDPLSALLAVARAVSEGRDCNTRIAVFDGRRRYDLVFTDHGIRRLTATRYAAYGEARRCDFVYEPVAGFKLDTEGNADRESLLRSGRAWVAPVAAGAPAAPVRVEIDGGWGMTVIQLRDVRAVTGLAEEPLSGEPDMRPR